MQLSIRKFNGDCERYLAEHYKNCKVDFKRSNVSETYGEILYPSVQKITHTIPFTAHDTFLDIGSGLGKAVIQVFLNTDVKTAMGIEINPELHAIAKRAAQDLPEVSFQCADVKNITLPPATIVLIGSPCFSPALISEISQKLIANKTVHSIFSMRPIESEEFKFKRALRLEASWDTALCFLYRRRTSASL